MIAHLEPDDLLGSLRAVIIAVTDRLPEQDVTNVWELVDAGEPSIALENLCTQLYEYDVILSRDLADQVVRLATSMGRDSDRLLEGIRPTS